MCFRPTEISMNACPQCGSSNKPISKVCESCGAPLEMKKIELDADQAALDSANTFLPPRAPGTPPAPGAPKAPGAPPKV